ncbi:MAG: DUF4374 domain-containing protein [Aestuariibaculum sp.]
MKLFKKMAIAIVGLTAIFSFTSCSDDDNNDTTKTIGDSYVLSLAIQGTDSNFTYYTVPFSDVMSGTLSATGTGIEQPGYYDFTQIDDVIYSMGGLGLTEVVGIYKNDTGELAQKGNVSLNAGLSDMVKADANTLVSVSMSALSDQVTFRTYNKSSVTVTNTVNSPVSNLTETGDNPAYSGMAVSGNYLFLSYYLSADDWSTNYTDEAQIAVYTYPEFEFVKVITTDKVGPIGGFNIKSGLTLDENGNIYAISHSNPANGFSQSTKPSGILKINAGETEFDTDYFFDIEEATEGFNTAHLKYLDNGLAFAEITVAERSGQERWSDSPLKAAIINLNTQTVNVIDDIPEHTLGGRKLVDLALHDDGYIYLCIPQDSEISVYKINPNTYTATKGATVQANFVAGFFKL